MKQDRRHLILAVLIFVDDPGPVTFSQKRVGRDKKFFQLHKFRSMKRNAPRDVPTHLLTDPERYITRFGRFLRRSSLDELPQVWDIFVGNMSVVGPRPALWNQDDLVAERDRLEVNGCRPGLTGWAQTLPPSARGAGPPSAWICAASSAPSCRSSGATVIWRAPGRGRTSSTKSREVIGWVRYWLSPA